MWVVEKDGDTWITDTVTLDAENFHKNAEIHIIVDPNPKDEP